MSFKKSVGDYIPVASGAQWLRNYVLAPNYYHAKKIKGFFFGADIITELLQVPNAVGVRMYHGLEPSADPTERFKAQLMLVPVDKDGNDLVQSATMVSQVADQGHHCPPYCAQPGQGLEDY